MICPIPHTTPSQNRRVVFARREVKRVKCPQVYLGLGPDNFLSVRTSGRQKNLGRNRPRVDPVFIRPRWCGLSEQPDNSFATFFPLKWGIFLWNC